jgi:hypothetical protein
MDGEREAVQELTYSTDAPISGGSYLYIISEGRFTTQEETISPLKKTRKKVNPAIMINPANIRIPAIDP